MPGNALNIVDLLAPTLQSKVHKNLIGVLMAQLGAHAFNVQSLQDEIEARLVEESKAATYNGSWGEF